MKPDVSFNVSEEIPNCNNSNSSSSRFDPRELIISLRLLSIMALTSSGGTPIDFMTAEPNGNVSKILSMGKIGTIAATFNVSCSRFA